jgi:hypothetical protein
MPLTRLLHASYKPLTSLLHASYTLVALKRLLHASYTPFTRLLHARSSYTPPKGGGAKLLTDSTLFTTDRVPLLLTAYLLTDTGGYRRRQACKRPSPLTRLLHASYTPLTRLFHDLPNDTVRKLLLTQ